MGSWTTDAPLVFTIRLGSVDTAQSAGFITNIDMLACVCDEEDCASGRVAVLALTELVECSFDMPRRSEARGKSVGAGVLGSSCSRVRAR